MAFLFALLLLAALWLWLHRCRSCSPAWERFTRFRYAHRGLYGEGVPENSLAAFRRAVDRGFGVELDVHLLADGSLAVFHDSDLSRMTGRAGVLEDLTAAELSGCALAGTDETIPQFCEVLRIFAGTGLPLIVELKPYRGNHAALTARTVAELDRFDVVYCLESFDPRCLRALRRTRPELIRGQLSRDFLHAKPRPGVLDFLTTRLLLNFISVPDFIAYRYPDRHAAPLALCRQLFGARTVYWTLHDEPSLRAAEAEGAVVIFEHFIPKEK